MEDICLEWNICYCSIAVFTLTLNHMECLHTAAAAAAVRGAGRCHDNTVRPHRAKSLWPFVATVLSQTVSCSGDSGQVCLRAHAGHAPYTADWQQLMERHVRCEVEPDAPDAEGL